MPIYALSDALVFPPCAFAEEDGLLAVGGDLSVERLLLAYQQGIFPWFSDFDPILWWAPDPRFVLYPDKLKISKSMKQVFRKKIFNITFDHDFQAVITACQQHKRKFQDGTWITDEMLESYCRLHELGWAHSVEVWNNESGDLVGGLYGLAMGSYFSGESMFALESNASKAGFITLVQFLIEQNYAIIDCQLHTNHLESLGAEEISRDSFVAQLSDCMKVERLPGKWNYFNQKSKNEKK